MLFLEDAADGCPGQARALRQGWKCHPHRSALLLKRFKPFSDKMDVEFRAEAYNIFNHTQFRIYDPSHPGNSGNNIANCYGDISTSYSAGAADCLVGNSFLHPVDAHDPRILQFGLKGSF